MFPWFTGLISFTSSPVFYAVQGHGIRHKSCHSNSKTTIWSFSSSSCSAKMCKMSNLIKFEMPKFSQEKCISARAIIFTALTTVIFAAFFIKCNMQPWYFVGKRARPRIFPRNVAIPTYPALPLYRKFPEFRRKIEPQHKMLLEIPQLFSPDKRV